MVAENGRVMINLRVQGIGMTSPRTRRRLVRALFEQGIKNVHVLKAMEQTPRHLFVDEALASRAYENTALPIGANQTISQPYVVARMTELLLAAEIKVKRVLDIGTGSGYQAAILSQLVNMVFTVERIEALQLHARTVLQELKYNNIFFHCGDGYNGWLKSAPYDGILVAAAPETVPQALLEQLKPGGRLIIPVGAAGKQQIRVITREDQGFSEQTAERVSFVPMLSGHF